MDNLTKKPVFRNGPPPGKLVGVEVVSPPQELADRFDLFEKINTVLKDSKNMTPQKRYAHHRVRALRELHKNLTAYQELLMEQQVTLKQMRLALKQEIRISNC